MSRYRLESAGTGAGDCGRCGAWLGPADPARMVIYVDPRHGEIDCGLACEDCAPVALAELNAAEEAHR